MLPFSGMSKYSFSIRKLDWARELGARFVPTDLAEKFGFLLTCLLRKGTAGYENPAERSGSIQQTNANHKETKTQNNLCALRVLVGWTRWLDKVLDIASLGW